MTAGGRSVRRIAGEEAMVELAAAIGDEAARQLARHLGGTTVYVPRHMGEHHPVRAAIGEVAAAKLAEWCGGSRVNVPKQPERQERVRSLRRKGALTIAAIALETGYSERHVYRLLSDGTDDRQLGLFDE